MRHLPFLSFIALTFLLASVSTPIVCAQYNRFDVIDNAKRAIVRAKPKLPKVRIPSQSQLNAISRNTQQISEDSKALLDKMRESLRTSNIALAITTAKPGQNLFSNNPLYLSPMHQAEGDYAYYEHDHKEDADYVEGCKSRLKKLLAYRAADDPTLWIDSISTKPFRFHPAKKYYMRLVEIYESQDSLQMAQAVLADAIEFDSINRKEYLRPMINISLGLGDKETAALYATMQAEDYVANAHSLTGPDWDDALEVFQVLITCGDDITAIDYLRALEPHATCDDIKDKINALLYAYLQDYVDFDISDADEETLRAVIEILDEAQQRDADARLMTNKRPLLPDEMARISQLCRIYEALGDIDKLEYYASIEDVGNYWKRLYYATGSPTYNDLVSIVFDNDFCSQTAERYLRHPESEALRKAAIDDALVVHTVRISELSAEWHEHPLLQHLDSILHDTSYPNPKGRFSNVNARNFYEAVDSARLETPELQQLFEALTKTRGNIRATMPKKSMLVIPSQSCRSVSEDGYEYVILIGKDENEDRIGKIVDDTFPFIDYLKDKGIKKLYILYPSSKQNPYAWERSLPKKIKPIRAVLTSNE